MDTKKNFESLNEMEQSRKLTRRERRALARKRKVRPLNSKERKIRSEILQLVSSNKGIEAHEVVESKLDVEGFTLYYDGELIGDLSSLKDDLV